MPAKPVVVSTAEYAVRVAEVCCLYKTDFAAVPPDVPASYAVTVVLKGIGKPESPQLRFPTAVSRNAFFDAVIDAMV